MNNKCKKKKKKNHFPNLCYTITNERRKKKVAFIFYMYFFSFIKENIIKF